jgi:predicted dehydrogenase
MGGIARHSHLPAFRTLAQRGDLAIVAGVDPLLAGRTVDGIPVVAHQDELARFGPIDFVDICTPTSSHIELVEWALGHGCHVLCEKPVALDAGDASRIRRAAASAGRVVMPCHQHRYNPAWLKLRGWVESGAIGPWHLAEFQVHRPAADRGTDTSAVPWRGRSEAGLGGVLLDHGTHLLYLLMDLAGPPAAVQAWTGRLRHHDYEVEDTAQVLLDFGPRLGNLFLTWAGFGRENRIRFVGERGQAEWRGGELRLDSEAGEETHDFTAALDKSAYAGWFASLFADFVAAIGAGAGDGLAGLDDLERVAIVLDLAYRSAAEGHRLTTHPVPVP